MTDMDNPEYLGQFVGRDLRPRWLSRGAEVRAYLSISTENERLGEPPIYLSLEIPCAFEAWSLSPGKKRNPGLFALHTFLQW